MRKAPHVHPAPGPGTRRAERPALAGAGLLGARLRRAAATAAEREAALQGTVAELRQERDELQRTASCDPLTGVWNYRHLQITLDKEIERARRAAAGDEKRPLALLMLEITGFDAVVAEHGRSRAGAVLRDLAQRLAVEIRRSDTLGRYGGEEFLVLLPDTGAEGAVQVAERLVWTVRRHRLLDWSGSGAEPRPADTPASPAGAPPPPAATASPPPSASPSCRATGPTPPCC
ncbi:GGDEF domain-containing protein [Kitasatospora arboriphila]